MLPDKRTLSAMLCLSLALALLPGCETTGGAAGTGAAIGAGIGAVIGHQSGHALEGAAIGAAVGAGAGAIAHREIKARQARNAQETAAAYNYAAVQGEKLVFEQSTVMPAAGRPGSMLTASTQYALLGAGPGVEVTETRSLLRGEQVIADIASSSITRTDATWVSEQEFRIPTNLSPGVYTILTRVSTRRSAISGRANFTVE